MSDFGAHLKEAREARAIPLRQIAAATKISVSALEALERNDFSRLPGGIFSRAFVRGYALEVGLDPDETVQSFLEEYARADSKRDTGPRPEITPDDRAFLARQQRAVRMLRWLLIVVVLLAAGGVAFWRYRAFVRPTPKPAANGAVTPAPDGFEGRVPSPTPATPALSPPTVSAPGAGAHKIAVHLDVIADCWVAVRADGTSVVRQLLHPGDRRDLFADTEMSIEVGDSAAVTWTINGQAAKELGRPGQKGSATITPDTLAKFAK